MIETLAQEFSRLVGEYQDPDAGESTKAEAWNCIADFAVEHSGTIIRALSPKPDGGALASPRDWFVWLREQTDDSGAIPADRLAFIARFIRAYLAAPVQAPVAVKMEAERDALREERDRLRAALITAGRNVGAGLADEVSTDFLMLVPEEIRLVAERNRASNEALRVALERIIGMDSHIDATPRGGRKVVQGPLALVASVALREATK